MIFLWVTYNIEFSLGVPDCRETGPALLHIVRLTEGLLYITLRTSSYSVHANVGSDNYVKNRR